jgi:hypothetical protein
VPGYLGYNSSTLSSIPSLPPKASSTAKAAAAVITAGFNARVSAAASVSCIEDESTCDQVRHCSTERFWRLVDEAVRRVLSSPSLADLVAERQLLQIEPLPAELASR